MKRYIILLLSSLFAFNALANNLPNTRKKVLISQVLAHPALDITSQGIIDGLAQSGFSRNIDVEIRIESAQGNAALAAQIAHKFINQSPDIVVGVGTLSAQSFAQAARAGKTKLIFSSVTDPIQAQLINSIEKPGNNTSGVSNFFELRPQLALIRQLQPQLQRLGILYNPAELNSVSIVKKLEALCPEFKLILVKQTANKTADVPQAATKLASQVDAIFISNDNTALSALQSLSQIANKVPIPVYVSDTAAVELGALAALGPDQYQIGIQTGKMIARILNGEDLNTIPVEFPLQAELYINLQAAQITGIPIPKSIQEKAAKIIPESPL